MNSFVFLFVLVFSFPIFTQTIEVSFVADSRFGKVNGKFTKSQIQVSKDEKTAQVSVDISSLQTGNSLRDRHLLGEDFFYVEKYPTANFILESLTPIGENLFRGSGKLTIKNVTKEISFQLSQTQDKAKVYIGTTEINRFDFGVNYDSIINKISEKVLIHFKITKD